MKRIRILHTADLYLDGSYAALGVDAALGNRLRMAQLSVFNRIVDRAKSWPADAVCIAGNLFDGPWVSRTVMDYVLGALEQLAPARVYIAPGGSDPYAPDSPYALELWPENVFLFTPGAWQSCVHDSLPLTVHGLAAGGGTVAGAPPPFPELPDDGRIHVAVVHGVEQDGRSPGQFNIAGIARDGLAYLALGGRAGMAAVDTGCNTVAWYPGTPQGRGFEQCGSRYFLEVEFAYDADPASPHISVSPVDAADVLFEDLRLTADQAADAGPRFDALHEADARDRVVRVRLEGNRPLYACEAKSMVLREARRRFLHTVVSDETGIPAGFTGAVRTNTCLCKLVDAMGGKIIDEPDRDAAVQEAEALEVALKACRDEGLTAEEGMELSE